MADLRWAVRLGSTFGPGRHFRREQGRDLALRGAAANLELPAREDASVHLAADPEPVRQVDAGLD